MSKKKKQQESTFTAFGVTVLQQNAYEYTYQTEYMRTDAIHHQFDLATAIAYHDHEYALYPLTEYDVLTIRLVGSPWQEDTDYREANSYTVSLCRMDSQWNNMKILPYESSSSALTEMQLVSLLDSIGLSPHEPYWLSCDMWDYATAKQQEYFLTWLPEEVRRIREGL